MKPDRKSLRFKITLPIFIISAILFLFVLLTSHKLLNGVIKEYQSLFISRQSFEIKKILDKAIAELTSAQLIEEEAVVEAKKIEVIDELRFFWSHHNFKGVIKKEMR